MAQVSSLTWLTPLRCHLILASVLILGFLGHLYYLSSSCPIDLSGDEAYYWDWSRRLDLGYYNAGPLVAYLIRASCAIFGENMVAVRLPAMVLAAGTLILTYWITRRLFGSGRLALGAVLLHHLAPLLVAGSLLITYDSPSFFFWALATCLAFTAIWDRREWAWAATGAAVGLGLLAKYTMLWWLIGLVLFLVFDQTERKLLRSVWSWLGGAMTLIVSLPVIVWNMRHDWISVHYVVDRISGDGRLRPIAGLMEFIGGQFLVLGPPLFIVMIFALIHALRKLLSGTPEWRAVQFLLCMGMPLLLLVTLMSLRTKIQANWPAPAYFALIILSAWFLSKRLQSVTARKHWQGWFCTTVVFGLVMLPLIHYAEAAYPIVDWVNWNFAKGRLGIPNVDASYKLRGWAELGDRISAELRDLGQGAFLLCDHYQTTAELAFYVQGQPRTYYAGSYFTNPAERRRFSQYDMWADRRLDSPELLGRNAIYVGEMNNDILQVFEKVEKMSDLQIVRGRWELRRFQYWRCTSFRNMHRPPGDRKY